MKRQRIAFGPGASSLILIAVVLALSVLTVLTMIAARNDEALSQRTVETRRETNALFAQGERSLAALDALAAKAQAEAPENYLAAVEAGLPEGMRLEGDQVSWEEKLGNRALACAARLAAPGETPRVIWTLHRLGEADIWDDSFEEDYAGMGIEYGSDESDGDAMEADEEEKADDFDEEEGET